MKIAFIGDVHGCVLHALGALTALQAHRGIRLDAAIQVGDLGAYPTPARMDEPSRRFAAENPTQGDFFRLLDPPPALSSAVRRALTRVPPVVFVSGNHEDFDWLAGLHEAAGTAVVSTTSRAGQPRTAGGARQHRPPRHRHRCFRVRPRRVARGRVR